MELYNANTMPLSNNPKLKAVQEKLLKGEELTVMEKVIAGRDHPIKELANYKLKPDHCYRAVNERTYQKYLENGFVLGESTDDEYIEFENNKGVDWYLGGVELKYGDIVLECPADKEYFTPACDNGSGMSYDPNVRFFKSSGAKNPIPMTMITNVFDVKELKSQKDKENLEKFLKIRELDRQRMMQLRQQQLENANLTISSEAYNGGKTL